MPSTPQRSKKALQEIARVFNRLASELAADLNQAVRDIDVLKREVQRLKQHQGKATGSTTSHHKTLSRRAPTIRSGPSHETAHHPTGPSETRHEAHKETHHESSKPSHDQSPFVFPQEPFNAPSSSETPASQNN